MYKKLSVIVPAYNVGPYITRCIDSILAQPYRPLEIIVVNDGSTDNTASELEKYQNKPQIHIYTKPNGGLSDARNFGLKFITGNYVTFVDSDDYLSPETYTPQTITKMDNTDILVFPYKMVNQKGDTLRIPPIGPSHKILTQDKILSNYILTKNYSVCNKIFNACLFQKEKFPINRYFEDFAFTIKILPSVKSMIITDKGMYNYIQDNSGSITKSTNVKAIEDMQIHSKEWFSCIQTMGYQNKTIICLLKINILLTILRWTILSTEKILPPYFTTMSKSISFHELNKCKNYGYISSFRWTIIFTLKIIGAKLFIQLMKFIPKNRVYAAMYQNNL